MKARIVVVDDAPQIHKFMRISLVAEGFEYVAACTGREALDELKTRQADLVILDLGLPDMDGFEVLQTLRSWSQVPVLVLTARDAEDEKVKLLNGGANDYLSKPFGIRELVARVRVLLRDLHLSPAVTPKTTLHFEELSFDLPNYRVFQHGQSVTLSRKEFALLSFLARTPGQLITQQQLLMKVWGASHCDDAHYLRIVVSQLRKKLNDSAEYPRLIQTEPGVGYRFIDSPVSGDTLPSG